MSREDFKHEMLAVQNTNFKLGFYLDLSVSLACQAATVPTQFEDEVRLSGSATLDLVSKEMPEYLEN